MPLHSWKSLANLGKWARPNSSRTTRDKASGKSKEPKKRARGKENQPEAVHQHRSARLKDTFKSVFRLPLAQDSGQAPQDTREASLDIIIETDATRESTPIFIDTPPAIDFLDSAHHPTIPELPVTAQGDAGTDAQSSGVPDTQPSTNTRGSDVETASESDSDDQEQLSDPRPGFANDVPHVDNKPPSMLKAKEALEHLNNLLRPRSNPDAKGKQRIRKPKVSGWPLRELERIQRLLILYTSDRSNDTCAPLREGVLRYLPSIDELLGLLPESPQELCEFLQTKGKYLSASAVVEFTRDANVQDKWGIDTVSLSQAIVWLEKMGYRFKRKHNGQYIDGHERGDVVDYRTKEYIPRYLYYSLRTRTYTGPDLQEVKPPDDLQQGERLVVFWFHDESTFYAHDRRESQWVAPGECPQPHAKGEGVSMMVADFISAEYGFLRSPDGLESARRVFCAGKSRDGYLTNDDILAQARDAMNILTKYYPNEEHVLVFDNATIHLKRPENGPSARKMPKNTPKEGKNWGVDVMVRGPDGQIVRDASGKPMKQKIRMAPGELPNGDPQEFYFPPGHPREGVFKGMATILEERGYAGAHELPAQCADFKCDEDSAAFPNCCCRRRLYSEPDFSKAPSALELLGKEMGFPIMFLPKFHPELNFIEMVWGRAKYHYRLNPPSSSEADLRKNMLDALGKVTITEMRRYARRCHRFLDAYRRGLNGSQAAWACRKYHGHRVLPNSIMEELDKE